MPIAPQLRPNGHTALSYRDTFSILIKERWCSSLTMRSHYFRTRRLRPVFMSICNTVESVFVFTYKSPDGLMTRPSGSCSSVGPSTTLATFTVLPDILGEPFKEIANYFNDCRTQRNTIEYCDSGAITKKEAEKLIQEVKTFKIKILAWLETSQRQRQII